VWFVVVAAKVVHTRTGVSKVLDRARAESAGAGYPNRNSGGDGILVGGLPIEGYVALASRVLGEVLVERSVRFAREWRIGRAQK
jgi:hypothetical protein